MAGTTLSVESVQIPPLTHGLEAHSSTSLHLVPLRAGAYRQFRLERHDVREAARDRQSLSFLRYCSCKIVLLVLGSVVRAKHSAAAVGSSSKPCLQVHVCCPGPVWTHCAFLSQSSSELVHSLIALLHWLPDHPCKHLHTKALSPPSKQYA